MNQILSTSNENKNNKRSSTIGNKKSIVFFCIGIAILGLIIISIAGYSLYNKKNKEASTLEISAVPQDDFAKITAYSNIGIQKIIYYWNENDKIEVLGNGTTNFEKLIDIPQGENNLFVQVIDIEGNVKETTNSFILDNTDTTQPTIELSVITDEARLKIIVIDETELDYITYNWNTSEQIRIEANQENNKQIEETIDLIRGENTLNITAVDKAGNEAIKTQLFKGVNKPIIDVVQYGNYIEMKISHDMGFEKVEFIINGETYTYDENSSAYSLTQTLLDYTMDLKEGENTVIINAKSTEGTEEQFKGKCVYNP